MKRKRLAVLLAFGLLATMFVVASGSANAATDSQLLYVHCGFDTGEDNQESTSAFQATVSITAPDSVNAGDPIDILVDVNEAENGPFVSVAAGVMSYYAQINVSGAAVESGSLVDTADFVNANNLATGEQYDVSPGSTDAVAPYNGLTATVNAAGTAGSVTLEISRFVIDATGAGAYLECTPASNASDGNTSDKSDINYVHPVVTVDVLGPEVSVTSIDEVVAGSGQGQTVLTHARPGVNKIVLEGSGLEASAALTAEICDVGAPAGDTSCESAAAAGSSTNASGAFSGLELPVDSDQTDGSRDIVVTAGADSVSIPITILGTRTISLTPNPGTSGAPLDISGANWDPGETIAIEAYDGVPGPPPTGGALTADSGSAVADANGSLDGTIALSDPDTAFILGVEDEFSPAPPPAGTGILTGTAGTAFSYSANSCAVTAADCSIDQTVILDVLPGQLTQSWQNGVIDLLDWELNGLTPIDVVGAINAITVTDATGDSEGWTLTGTISDLTNEDPSATGDNTIEGAGIAIIPVSCSVAAGGSGTDGTPGDVGVGTATLCVVGDTVGNGSWTVNAQLGLTIPIEQNAGTYSGTFTTTLS